MKNIVAIFIIIIALSGLVAYGSNNTEILLPKPYGILKPGKYTCPYTMYNDNTKETTNSCIIEAFKTGAMTKTNCPNRDSEILPIIKAGKCKFETDKTISYSCKYPEGSCGVTLGDSTKYLVSCTGKTPNSKTVLQDAKNGKCQKIKKM